MCDRRTDMKKKMRGVASSKNICEGAKEQANENIIESGTLINKQIRLLF
jgi:hypothetical protein